MLRCTPLRPSPDCPSVMPLREAAVVQLSSESQASASRLASRQRPESLASRRGRSPPLSTRRGERHRPPGPGVRPRTPTRPDRRRPPQEQEEAVLTKRVQKAVDVSNHVLRALRTFDRLASTGVAARPYGSRGGAACRGAAISATRAARADRAGRSSTSPCGSWRANGHAGPGRAPRGARLRYGWHG